MSDTAILLNFIVARVGPKEILSIIASSRKPRYICPNCKTIIEQNQTPCPTCSTPLRWMHHA